MAEKRLIDANKLLKDARQCRAILASLADIVDIEILVTDQPTVDAVEVVHGRWIEKEYVDEPYGGYYLFHCSECGIPNARERNYCPNCGAYMMDGDSDAET